MKKAIIFTARVCDRFTEYMIPLYAAEATLFLIISAVPFIMLLLNMIQFIIPFTQQELVNFSEILIPAPFLPIVKLVIGEAYRAPGITFVSVTTIAAAWAASKGVTSLVKGLDAIYSHSGIRRSYLKQRIYSFIYTIAFIISIVITLTAITLGSRILEIISENFPHLHDAVVFIDNVRTAFFFVFLTLVFAVGYRFIPKDSAGFAKGIPGAMTASAAWLAFSYGFGIYVEHFSNYSNIYGGLTAVVLFVIWLYSCINIFLIGAVINSVI